jgi:hypothetical protein
MDALQPQFMDALQPQIMGALQPQFMDALQPQFMDALQPQFMDALQLNSWMLCSPKFKRSWWCSAHPILASLGATRQKRRDERLVTTRVDSAPLAWLAVVWDSAACVQFLWLPIASR